MRKAMKRAWMVRLSGILVLFLTVGFTLIELIVVIAIIGIYLGQGKYKTCDRHPTVSYYMLADSVSSVEDWSFYQVKNNVSLNSPDTVFSLPSLPTDSLQITDTITVGSEQFVVFQYALPDTAEPLIDGDFYQLSLRPNGVDVSSSGISFARVFEFEANPSQNKIACWTSNDVSVFLTVLETTFSLEWTDSTSKKAITVLLNDLLNLNYTQQDYELVMTHISAGRSVELCRYCNRVNKYTCMACDHSCDDVGCACGTYNPDFDFSFSNVLKFLPSQESRVKVSGNSQTNFDNGDFSLSFWVKTSSGSNTRLINKWPSSGMRWATYIYGNNLQFQIRTGAGVQSVVSRSFGSLDTWKHVVIVKQTNRPKNWKLYINNSASSLSFPDTTWVSGTFSDNLDMEFGAGTHLTDDTDTSTTLHMDEVSIYRRALTASEISCLYNSGSGSGIPASALNWLVGYWKLNGKQTKDGQYVAPDDSPNQLNGYLQNFSTRPKLISTKPAWVTH